VSKRLQALIPGQWHAYSHQDKANCPVPTIPDFGTREDQDLICSEYYWLWQKSGIFWHQS